MQTITVKRSDFTMLKVAFDDPDLSYLGEYSKKRTSEHSIDRSERHDMQHGQYRYFTPAVTAEQTGNPDSPEQDYRRMEAYNAGEWHMVGIRAAVEIALPASAGNVIQVLKSPGVYGIESDSGDEYFKEVFAEECEMLAEMISAIACVKLMA